MYNFMSWQGGGLRSWMVLLVIWDLVWRGLALWRSAQEKKQYWFIAMLVLNTAGILPLVYLIFFAKKKILKIKK